MWAAIGSFLLIIIGLWKFFWGRADERKKKQKEAANEVKEGIDKRDPSIITGGLDDLNRVRRK